MKTISCFLIIAVLTGCMTVPFDSMQYDRLADIVSSARITNLECSDPSMTRINVTRLLVKTEIFEVSTKYRGNAVYNDSAVVMKDLTKALSDSYTDLKTPSKAYCTLKTDEIKTVAEHTLIIMGKK